MLNEEYHFVALVLLLILKLLSNHEVHVVLCRGKQISTRFCFFHTRSLKLTSKLTVAFIHRQNKLKPGQAHQRPIAAAEKSKSHPVQISGVHFWDKQLMPKNYQDFPATLTLEAHLNEIWTLKLFHHWGYSK